MLYFHDFSLEMLVKLLNLRYLRLLISCFRSSHENYEINCTRVLRVLQ